MPTDEELQFLTDEANAVRIVRAVDVIRCECGMTLSAHEDEKRCKVTRSADG